MGKSMRSNQHKRNRAVRREKIEASDLTKERESSKQAAMAKALAAPKMSDTEEFKQLQAERAMAMDEDSRIRKARAKKAKADVQMMDVDLKPKGGVAKRKKVKGIKPQSTKPAKQGEENYDKLKTVGLFVGANPIQFTRLHKKYKKGRKPGIRAQMGIE